MDEKLTVDATLPRDRAQATLVGRVWLPSEEGPALVAVRGDGLFDITRYGPTMSLFLERSDRVAIARTADAPRIGELAAVLANSRFDRRQPPTPWLLAPCDLQAIKAAGVTFVKSMLERVIEEQARGDASRAQAIRERVEAAIGGSLRSIVPGSEAAARVKEELLREGLWSQYLEVGIGPDAEIFTKAQPMSAVGHGAEVGLHSRSSWNNPEPEIVLVVAASGEIVGATLGNDVNLRDVEGRSALLLGKAKDNNASCALGPFLRLFDDAFDLDAVRTAELLLEVDGPDGFRLEATSSMREISRDPADLVAQMIGPHHRYPDGAVLFCGTMFAPVQDRGAPGMGFTHAIGDVVTIRSERLGGLVNRVSTSERAEAWTFGSGALMRNLARRGHLGAG
ncbi:MAG: fumarylacetoacetate hydrolase family protein [Geminicoccaceae bacterium]|nr:fumarylacetoacetate hydrolase family protein [Geminicoccaceae bacterium]